MRRLAFVLAALTAFTACDDEMTFNTEGGGGTGELMPGYCGVQQIMYSDCISCHAADAPTAGLDLETDPYTALAIDGDGYFVIPGDADGSLLFQKITDTQADDAGGLMPPGEMLGEEAIQAIEDWINNGATQSCAVEG